MNIPFLKMSGAGNDFVVVDRMKATTHPGWEAIVPAICDRRGGVGADGVILVSPAADADFTMHYFNADGSTGSMCGNGGRCAAAYMMGVLGKTEVTFLAAGRVYHAVRSANGVKLKMDEPGPAKLHLPLQVRDGDFVGHFIDTGSPHLVIVGDNRVSDSRAVVDVGRELRRHEVFRPSGTNVDFITVTGPNEVAIRTYERGVEDETWSCGTGAVAAALIHSLLDGGEGTRSVRVTPLSGKTLVVTFRRTGITFKDITLDGPAEVTFRGSYETAS